MRRPLMPLLCALLLWSFAGVQAQPSAIPEPPVRYDEDLLPPAFHQSRRQAVLEALPQQAVAFFFSAPERNRENDVDYRYRQSSDLYYLTGTHEPETVLLLAPGGIEVDGERVQELLLVPPRTAYSDVWLGRRFGPERAQAELGIEKAVSNERFEAIAAPLLQDETVAVYHSALPDGIPARSGLAPQVDLLTSLREPLELEGNFRVRPFLEAALTLDDPDAFARYQPLVADQVDPQRLSQPVLQQAIAAFIEAPSLEAWRQWKTEHLGRYSDGILPAKILEALRMQKTEEELVLLQRAIDITVEAHREAMRSLEPGMHEYEIEALVEYIFRRNGAAYAGFPSIVGSGENAVILHYNTNRRQMQAGDVVVIDIGAEYHGYTADVTRTLPVSGTFSPEQKAIYELVLRAQEAGIEAARAGNPFGAPGQAAQQVIAEGLRELGLIQDEADVRNFFMHGTSHYLGLYVHDVGDYGPLQPGQVITVEPGIYISPSPDVDPAWWNIGVRIEDDILITDGAPVNLSAGAPRAVAEVEALMQERGLGNDPAGLVPRSEENAVGINR